MHRFAIRTLLAVVISSTATLPLHAQKKEETEAQQTQRNKLEYFRDKMRKHHLSFPENPDRPFEFVEEPLFRFKNPVSRIIDGFMFAWTDGGRPVAVAKSYYNLPRETWGRTFVLLASKPIEMQIGRRKAWYPRKGAVTFSPLKDAPQPADNERLRLVQMRRIARRFQVVDHWGLNDPKDWQLRLLPTPLHRYNVPDENVVDAAMFGYVLTSSPEALLLLEARKTENGMKWFYAVSRCTRFEITFSLDDRKIANFPRLEGWPPTGPYFHIPLAIPDYPYKNNGQ